MRLTRPAIATLISLGSLFVGSDLSAQFQGEPVIILRTNEVVPSLGLINSLSRIAVSDQGTVFTQATITSDGLRYIMRDAFPTFANDFLLPEPGFPGVYSMRSNGIFASFELDANTNVAWRLQTNNAGTGTGVAGDHTGIYYNLKLIHNDLDSAHTLAGIQTPFHNFPSGTLDAFTYDGFFAVDISNDGNLIVNCVLDTNGLAGGGQKPVALIMIEIDEQGNIQNETLLALGTSNAAPTDMSNNGLHNNQNSFHIANNGNWIASAKFDRIDGADTSGGDDWAVFVNSPTNIIAREGMLIPGVGLPSATGGNNVRASINSFGDFAYMIAFGNSFDRIIVDGQVLAGEGAVALNLPSLAPNSVNSLESINGPPLTITDSGDVYWYASLTGAGGRNRAFMRNQEVVIRKGISSIDGVLIRDIDNTQRGYTVSNNGRFWAGVISLAGGGDDAVVLIDFGLVVPIRGMQVNPSTLKKNSGDARIGQIMVLSMDGAQGPGALPVVMLSLQAARPGLPTGILTKFGELLIDLTPGIVLTQLNGPVVTSGPTNIPVSIPLDTSLVGMEAYAQGAFFDIGAVHGGKVINLTNGLFMIIGAF